MVLNLQTLTDTVDDTFRWIDKWGVGHRVEDMTTSHVFFSLRMLWNHNVPEDWRIEPYQRYILLGRSKDYIARAIPALICELNKRDDLTEYFISCLTKMNGLVSMYHGVKIDEGN